MTKQPTTFTEQELEAILLDFGTKLLKQAAESAEILVDGRNQGSFFEIRAYDVCYNDQEFTVSSQSITAILPDFIQKYKEEK